MKLIEFSSFLLIYVALLYCSFTDVKCRQISNKCVLLVFVFSSVLGLVSGHFNLLYPSLILVCGFFMAFFGVMGAGDIKLITVLCVGIPIHLISTFLILMCLYGMPLTLIMILFSRLVLKEKLKSVPFGVAISAGYLTATWGLVI